VHDDADPHDVVLLTNVPLTDPKVVRQVYGDWRQRGFIEPGYRFDQEQGLDVEDLRVTTLERMRRLFILVLLAAQFVCYPDRTWPQAAIVWLRLLGGKLNLPQDREWPLLAPAWAQCRLANRGDPGVFEDPPISSENPNLWVITAKSIACQGLCKVF